MNGTPLLGGIEFTHAPSQGCEYDGWSRAESKVDRRENEPYYGLTATVTATTDQVCHRYEIQHRIEAIQGFCSLPGCCRNLHVGSVFLWVATLGDGRDRRIHVFLPVDGCLEYFEDQTSGESRPGVFEEQDSWIMSGADLPVWLQALGVVSVLAFIIGIVNWLMREARKEFGLIRVFASV